MIEDILKNIEANDERPLRVLRLLQLIEGANQSIENARHMESNLMIKQYNSLRDKYVQELSEILVEYKLNVKAFNVAA